MHSSSSSLAAQAADLAADLVAALQAGGLPDDPEALIDLIVGLEKLKSAQGISEHRSFVDEELCADPTSLDGVYTLVA